MTKKNQLQKGEKIARTAIFLESFLAASKAVAGLLTGSVVLTSDALHSASDLFPIAASWLGLKIAQKEADKKFAYGYYKAENVAGAVVSLLVVYASWEVLGNGLNLLKNPSSFLKIPFLALAVSLADALILFFFGGLEIKVAEEINSRSLLAMGRENRTHLFSSGAVFLGILAAYWQIPYIEGIVTLVISLLILQIGFSAGKEALFSLMDIGPDREVREKIAEIIRSVAGIEEVSFLRLRKAGPFIMGEAEVGIRKDIDVQRSHQIAYRVERKVKQEESQVDSLAVQVKPFKSDYQHLVFPISQKKGLDSLISPRFGRTPYFLFVNLKGKKVKGHYFLANPHQKKEAKAGLGAAKAVISQKSDTAVVREMGEIAFYTLREALFDIFQTKEKTVKGALKKFQQGELKRLEKVKKRN